jgi:hypothetical protein
MSSATRATSSSDAQETLIEALKARVAEATAQLQAKDDAIAAAAKREAAADERAASQQSLNDQLQARLADATKTAGADIAALQKRLDAASAAAAEAERKRADDERQLGEALAEKVAVDKHLERVLFARDKLSLQCDTQAESLARLGERLAAKERECEAATAALALRDASSSVHSAGQLAAATEAYNEAWERLQHSETLARAQQGTLTKQLEDATHRCQAVEAEAATLRSQLKQQQVQMVQALRDLRMRWFGDSSDDECSEDDE